MTNTESTIVQHFNKFLQAVAMSVQLYSCTTSTLTKPYDKKLDENYTRIPHAVLNRSWKHYPTKQQLYGHLHTISQTIEVRRVRHASVVRTNS